MRGHHPAPRRGSVHDQLFKELIGAFLSDFLGLVAPGPALCLDLSQWKLLDKEIFTDWPKGRRRELDLLAEVPLREKEGRALVHVEIEARSRPEIGHRLAGYYMQLRLRHGWPVVPILACLRRGRPGVALETVSDDELGPEIGCFRFYVFGLEGCRAEDYLSRSEPLAWALAALMRPGDLSRAEHKMACLQRIAGARLNNLRRFLLVNCVETYLKLEGRDAAEFEALQASERGEDGTMRAIRMTWADEMKAIGREEGMVLGRQEGVALGKEEGVRKTVLRLLRRRFGPLPDEVKRRVEAIRSIDRLNQIVDQILVARSLEEMGLQ
ncbi:MAG TPA: DUF4351 domain-containing protein [Thermoanaerobaculia bacterium]